MTAPTGGAVTVCVATFLVLGACGSQFGPSEAGETRLSGTGFVLVVGDSAPVGIARREGRSRFRFLNFPGRDSTWPADLVPTWNARSDVVEIRNGYVHARRVGATSFDVSVKAEHDSATATVIASGGPSWPRVLDLVAGNDFTCARTVDRDVFCWGSSWLGQTGAGELRPMTSQLSPARVRTSSKADDLDAGSLHACALDTLGQAHCWGDNAFGQAAATSARTIARPTLVRAPQPFTQISTGSDHSCGLTQAGIAICWGRGLNMTSFSATAGAFASITSGATHRCGLTAAGLALCWGSNTYGELGTGDTERRDMPTTLSGNLRFSMLSAGTDYTCGVSVAGAGYCWGLGWGGRLGAGSENSSLEPQLIVGDWRLTSISAGTRHTCAVTTQHEVLCWGQELAGALGDGPPATQTPALPDLTRSVPARVAGNAQWQSVVAGTSGHSCALTTSDEAFCWGSNGIGELGLGRQLVDSTTGQIAHHTPFAVVWPGT